MAENPETEIPKKNYIPTMIVKRIMVCKAAPFSINPQVMMLDANDKCPYCQQPISEHEKMG